MPTALERLMDAVDAQYQEEPLEDLRRRLIELTAEIHTSNGSTTAKLDAVLEEQRALGTKLAVLEEREKSCQSHNDEAHRLLWKAHNELKTDTKSSRKTFWAAVGAVIVAAVSGIFTLLKH